MQTHLKNRLHFLLGFFSFALNAQFSPGNLVVLQAGNGTVPLANTGNQIVLREFSVSGVPTFSVTVPTVTNPLTVSGTAVSEGGLSLTPDGKYLVFAGYATGSYSASVSGASASALNRGVGIVNSSGSYSRVATSTSFYSGNSIRSATSDGNGNYWAGGGNAGGNYFGNNAPAATLQTSVTNTRNVVAGNGGLFFSTGSGTAGIYKLGTGYPVTPGQTCSLVIGTTLNGGSSPYAFCFDPAMTICYVADDRTPANNGGIQKWVYSINTWTLSYILGTGANYGARGVVADFSSGFPKVFATTSEGTVNRLIAITDLGPGSTATTIATASPNTIFRGLAFSPYCMPPELLSISSSSPVCSGNSFTLGSSHLGSAPLSFSWSGSGGFSSILQSPVLTASVSGIYSLSITNGCGIVKASKSVTVNSIPQLLVNQSLICSGGTATLYATGAVSYSWNGIAGSNSATFSPTASNVYSITGASAEGCINSLTSSVTVVNNLSLSVNSATVCDGEPALLQVTGALSYTWSNGSNSTSITVSPGVSTQFSVSGMAPGCLVPGQAASTVVVLPRPVVSIQGLLTVVCLDNGPLILTGVPAGGTFSGACVGSNTFDPMTCGTGTFPIRYQYFDINGCGAADSAQVVVDFCTFLPKGGEAGSGIHAGVFDRELRFLLRGGNRPAEVMIFDVAGKLLSRFTTRTDQGTIDLDSYPPGVYFLFVALDSQNLRLKFVLQ